MFHFLPTNVEEYSQVEKQGGQFFGVAFLVLSMYNNEEARAMVCCDTEKRWYSVFKNYTTEEEISLQYLQTRRNFLSLSLLLLLLLLLLPYYTSIQSVVQ